MSSGSSAGFFDRSRQQKRVLEQLEADVRCLNDQITTCQNIIEDLRTDSAYTEDAHKRLEELCDKQSAEHEDLIQQQQETQHQLQELMSTVQEYQEEVEKAREDVGTQQRANVKQLSDLRRNGALMHLHLNRQLGATNAKLQAVQEQLTQHDTRLGTHDTTSDMGIEIMEFLDKRLDTQSTKIADLQRTVSQLTRKQTNQKTACLGLHHKVQQELRKQEALQQMHVQNLDVGINGACTQISNLKRKFNDLEAVQEQLQRTVDGTKRRQTLELQNLNTRMQVENLNLNNKLQRCTEFVCRLDTRVEQNTEATEGLSMQQDFTKEELEDTKKELEDTKKELEEKLSAKEELEDTKKELEEKLSGMRKEFFLGGAVFCATTLGPALLGAMVTTLF